MINILHVDDCQNDVELTKFQLTRLQRDLSIDWAESAVRAIKSLEGAQYDCMLCDFQMPGMDGLQLLQALREKGVNIPIIFFTGQGNEEVAATALRIGADDYYTKDAGIAHYQRLLNSIQRVVEARDQKERHVLAQKALKKSEERYRAFIAQSTEGILRLEFEKPIPTGLPEDEQIRLYNTTAYVAECNDAYARMYGHQSSRDLIGKSFEEIFGGRKNLERIESLGTLIKSGYRVDNVETVEVDKEGEAKYFLNNAVGIIEDDHLTRVWLAQRDIGEFKHAEAELEKSRQLFEHLFIQNPLAAAFLDLDDRVQDVNPRFEKLFGFEKEGLRGEKINDLIVPDDKKEEAERLDRIGKEVAISHETVRVRHTGRKLHVAISGSPIIVDGETTGYLVLYNDISNLKNTEEALWQGKEDFQQLLEASQDLICKINLLTGNFDYVSPSVQAILGYTPDELVGKAVQREGELVHPRDAEALKSAMQSLLNDPAARKSQKPFEYRIRHKDGDYRRVTDQRLVIRDKEGNPTAVISTIRGITDVV